MTKIRHQNKELQLKLKRYGDKFGSSYVNVKVESKYADYGADYEIANYYDQSKRNRSPKLIHQETRLFSIRTKAVK